MGLRFRDSFEVFPGVRLNFSGGGISVTFGVPGASVNIGSRGVRGTAGIPGTGLSYTHSFSGGRSPRLSPPPAYAQTGEMRQINSAAVEDLTSEGLRELRQLIVQARAQHAEIRADLDQARNQFRTDTAELKKRRASIFRFLFKRRIAALEESTVQAAAEVDRLTHWLETTHVDIKFETGEEAKKAYGAMIRAFAAMSNSERRWDITSDRQTDRVAERSAASRTITRTPVTLDYGESDLVRFEGRAMRFENVNGEDILIYPGLVVMPRADGAFALIDIREVELKYGSMGFIETEAVPSDAEIIGHTWAKVNKDGSPDRRFKGNYQIPMVSYGHLLFTSPTGIEEEYQFSRAAAVLEFGRAFDVFKAALK